MKRSCISLHRSFLRSSTARVFHFAVLMSPFFIAQNPAIAISHSSILASIVPQSSTKETHSGSPTQVQWPYSFPISESELLSLAKSLAPKVDLFREIWEKDPEAEFFAGTTRDYLYWILGHFKGLENLESSAASTKQSAPRREQIEAIKQKLLATPFIKFNEIVGPESDADIMTKNRDVLSDLRAQDFAIRKLDFISFDRAVPGNPMYQDEINQGYIPSEKIRLSKNGIAIDPNFGNGVADLISGNLSIQFPDMKKFWKTHYAKEGANHPMLLALRYVRILAQDYLQRHGSDIPNSQKLEAPMTKEIKEKIKSLIQEAIANTDGSFKKFLQNHQGKKWLNASIQKSFRSFTNANAAFELMKELGLIGLIEVYPDEIESVHHYLLKAKRDEAVIAENFNQFRISPDDLYENIESFLPDHELYHGTASGLAFRNIIYQGVIPSDSGSAGRGLYGVSKRDLEFAKNWSIRKSRQDDLVIALKLKSSTKIVDITKGVGKGLFDRWEKSVNENRFKNINHTHSISPPTASSASKAQNQDLYDAFAHDFGIDLLRYPYRDTEAFVLKNADIIESRRGVFKNPRPLSELLSEATVAREKGDLYFLKDFLETPLTKDERNKIFGLLDEPYFKKGLESPHVKTLRNVLHGLMVTLFDLLLQSPFTATHALVWMEIPALMKDTNENIRLNMTLALQSQNTWPPSFWNEVPALMKDTNGNIRYYMASALTARNTWPNSFWDEITALMKDPDEDIRFDITLALLSQNSWPPEVWNEIPALMKDTNKDVRFYMTSALQKQYSWPASFWNEIPALMKDPDEDIRSLMAFALETRKSWPQNIMDLVTDSEDPLFIDLKKRRPQVLDLSTCQDSLSELQSMPSRNPKAVEKNP